MVAPVASGGITGARLHALRDGESRHVLPGIGEIAHLHRYETDFLYDEIFVRHAYLRHGITHEPGDTVFDIGANIGMFTMYVAHRYPGVRVYAFEPAEPSYARLAENIARHCSSGQAFHHGIADVDGLQPFTFYRNSTVFSGFNADYGRDEAVIRTVVENTLRRSAGSATTSSPSMTCPPGRFQRPMNSPALSRIKRTASPRRTMTRTSTRAN